MLMGNLRGAQDSLKFQQRTLPYEYLQSLSGFIVWSFLKARLEKQIQRENDARQQPEKGGNPSGDGPSWRLIHAFAQLYERWTRKPTRREWFRFGIVRIRTECSVAALPSEA